MADLLIYSPTLSNFLIAIRYKSTSCYSAVPKMTLRNLNYVLSWCLNEKQRTLTFRIGNYNSITYSLSGTSKKHILFQDILMKVILNIAIHYIKSTVTLCSNTGSSHCAAYLKIQITIKTRCDKPRSKNLCKYYLT